MNPTFPSLFSPFHGPTLELKNRLAMAPMTRERSPGGIPTDDVAAYYTRRAKGGVGLLITEGVAVDHPLAAPSPKVPHMYGREALAGWKRVVEGVHREGAKIIPQLWHVGPLRNAADFPGARAPISPSGLSKPDTAFGNAMTETDVREVIEAYGRSAAAAKETGFDGIEIHGAHGYLIDLFFWQATNRRSDRWGGDLVGRTTFAAEVIRACRKAVGPAFPIHLRFSQWKQQDYEAQLARNPEELAAFLEPLVTAGVDLFHCSSRRFWNPEFGPSPLNLAGWTKKITGKPVMTVGGVGAELFKESYPPVLENSVEAAEAMVTRGDVDLVAVGRGLLGDPEWAEKLRRGQKNEIQGFSKKDFSTLT